MKTLKTISILLIFAMILGSCVNKKQKELSKSQRLEYNSYGKEMKISEDNQKGLIAHQPQPRIKFSCERMNLIKRFKRFNDPNKISYIYLIDFGRIMAFYTIKGKVSSLNSLLSNPEQIVQFPIIDRHNSVNKYVSHAVSSAAEDGSYGDNGDGIFFFTTDDTYVEWNGNYMLCDKPLKLSTQPLLLEYLK